MVNTETAILTMTCPFLVSVSSGCAQLYVDKQRTCCPGLWVHGHAHSQDCWPGSLFSTPFREVHGTPVPHSFLSSQGTCIRPTPPSEAPTSGQWPEEKTGSHCQGQLSSWTAPLSPGKGTSQALSPKKRQLGLPKPSGNSKRKSTRTRNWGLGPTASFTPSGSWSSSLNFSRPQFLYRQSRILSHST